MTSAWSQTNRSNERIEYGDSASLDAFGRARVSQVLSLNISKFEYSKELHKWPELIVGGGSSVVHLPDEASNLLTAGPDVGDGAIKQSKCYAQYQPGNSQLGMLSGVFGAHEEGFEKFTMYGDAKNGVYFKQADGTYYVGLRSSTSGAPVDIEIAQSAWEIDTFELQPKSTESSKNPSKKIIDFTKSFIFFFDLEWLGVGRVRGGFVQDGVIYYGHEFLNAGNGDKVYMSTASLPLRYEIRNVSGSAPATMKQICSTVKSEGGQEIFGVPQLAQRSFYVPISVPDLSGTTGAYTPILSIRPRQLFNGIDFRGAIRPVEFEIFVEGNFPIEFLLVHDGTLFKGGGAPVPLVDGDWIDVSGDSTPVPSATEYTLAATSITIPSGHNHNAGFANGEVKGTATLGTDISTVIDLCNGIDIADRAEADTYTIVARAKGGTPTVSAVLRFVEIR